MANFKKALILAAILAAGSGCSMVGLGVDEFSPTHRWARPNTTVAQYNYQNVRCAEQSKVNLNGAASSSPEFLACRDCMEKKGIRAHGARPSGLE